MTITSMFVLFICISVGSLVSAGEPLNVQYSQVPVQDTEEVSYQNQYIDNHAYLKDQEERRRMVNDRPSAPVMVINNVSTQRRTYGFNRNYYNNNYPSRKYPNRYGCSNDNSWATGFTTGDTSFFYINGLSVNCPDTYTIIHRYPYPRPVPYRKQVERYRYPNNPKPVPYKKQVEKYRYPQK